MPNRVHPITVGGSDADEMTILTIGTTHDRRWSAACSSTGTVYFNGILEDEEKDNEQHRSHPHRPHASFVFNPNGLSNQPVATTCIAFRRELLSSADGEEGGEGGSGGAGRHLALTTSADGTVRQSAVDASGSGRLGGGVKGVVTRKHKELSRSVETGNEVLAASYDTSGSIFVTGGSDARLRVYDAETTSVISTITKTIGSHGQDTVGHNGRIFSIHFLDSMCFLSAGWESSMLLHDTRVRRAVTVFDGVHMSGDGIAILPSGGGVGESGSTSGIVAAASDRGKDQLQFFDLKTGKQTIPSVTTPMNLFSCVSAVGNNSCASAAGGKVWAVGSQPGGVVCVDAFTGEITESFVADGSGKNGNGGHADVAVGIAPHGLFGVASLADGTVYAGGARGGFYRIVSSW